MSGQVFLPRFKWYAAFQIQLRLRITQVEAERGGSVRSQQKYGIDLAGVQARLGQIAPNVENKGGDWPDLALQRSGSRKERDKKKAGGKEGGLGASRPFLLKRVADEPSRPVGRQPDWLVLLPAPTLRFVELSPN